MIPTLTDNPARAPIRLLKRSGTADAPDPDLVPVEDTATLSGSPPTLLCSACGHSITSRAALFEIQGGTEHRFTNPHGYRFRIACYREAPGCAGTGDWTAEHSWFHNTEWRYALCAACHTHLGWEYRGAGNFFGLIRDRLIESDIQHH